MSDHFFTWDKKEYTVHVDKMDDEHQKLISIMNELHKQFKAGATKEILGKWVKELGDYTVKHFGDEEAYMASIQYDGLETHKLIHKDLLEKFGRHVTEFQAKGVLGDGFFNFLKFWLASHIQGIDRKYSFKDKKVA